MPDPEFIQSRQMVAEMARRALTAPARVYHERALKLVDRVLQDLEGDTLCDSLYGAIPAALSLMERNGARDPHPFGLELLALDFIPMTEEFVRHPDLTDGAGQTRSVYLPLALHLTLSALAVCPPVEPESRDMYIDMVKPVRAWLTAEEGDSHEPQQDIGDALWRLLCRFDAADVFPFDLGLPSPAAVDAILAAPGPDGSLHPLDPDQSLDSWTYQELTGLHALTHLALKTGIRGNRRWLSRVQEIANYHLENTQPDHTTAQPWGLPAFLLWPQTRIFGQQQLHDAAANPGAENDVVTALLLADTACLLAGPAIENVE